MLRLVCERSGFSSRARTFSDPETAGAMRRPVEHELDVDVEVAAGRRDVAAVAVG